MMRILYSIKRWWSRHKTLWGCRMAWRHTCSSSNRVLLWWINFGCWYLHS